MLARLANLWQQGGEENDELDAVVGQGLTATDWIVAGAIFAGSILLARLVQAVIQRMVVRGDADESVARFAGRSIRNLIVLAGLVYALITLEVRIGPLLGVLGIGGLAVAFAAQSILENTFASVLLRTRRPFRRGDQITTGELSGTVVDVNFRTVVLRTYDGEKVLVPCSSVLGDAIVNHTVLGKRRTTLEVGVAYDSDLPRAQELLLAAAATVDDVMDSPPPEAFVYEFGESSINVALRFWHPPDIATMWRVRSAVAVEVKRRFDEAGVEIPFPQRVLTFTNPLDAAVHDGAEAATEGQR